MIGGRWSDQELLDAGRRWVVQQGVALDQVTRMVVEELSDGSVKVTADLRVRYDSPYPFLLFRKPGS